MSGKACGDAAWGTIDRNGEIVIPLEWHYLTAFDSEGLAVGARATNIDKRGIVSEDGQIIIEPEWDFIGLDSRSFGEVNLFDEGGANKVLGTST